MSAPRNCWQCPECAWNVAWAMTGLAKDDGDPGFLVMLHVRKQHPQWIEEGRPRGLEDILRGQLLKA